MYNRYIRNDRGVYERIPIQEAQSASPPFEEPRRPEDSRQAHAQEQAWEAPRWEPTQPPPRNGEKKQGFLSGLLGKLKLDEIDTGDLLLLVILFLLFKDGEDEELLIALGLLLIL